jgi:hypothetical protein
VWHGFASRVVTPLGTPARRPGPVISSKPRTRVVWHGNAGPQPPVFTPAPKLKPPLPRRKPARAVVRRGAGLVNAPPPLLVKATGTATVSDPREGAATSLDPQGGGVSTYQATYGPTYPGGSPQSTVTDPRDGTMSTAAEGREGRSSVSDPREGSAGTS